jgi:hypothetical protein
MKFSAVVCVKPAMELKQLYHNLKSALKTTLTYLLPIFDRQNIRFSIFLKINFYYVL